MHYIEQDIVELNRMSRERDKGGDRSIITKMCNGKATSLYQACSALIDINDDLAYRYVDLIDDALNGQATLHAGIRLPSTSIHSIERRDNRLTNDIESHLLDSFTQSVSSLARESKSEADRRSILSRAEEMLPSVVQLATRSVARALGINERSLDPDEIRLKNYSAILSLHERTDSSVPKDQYRSRRIKTLISGRVSGVEYISDAGSKARSQAKQSVIVSDRYKSKGMSLE